MSLKCTSNQSLWFASHYQLALEKRSLTISADTKNRLMIFRAFFQIWQASLDLVNDHMARNGGRLRMALDRLSTNKSSFHLSKMVCRALQTRGYHVLIGPPDPSLRHIKLSRFNYPQFPLSGI